MFIHVIVQLIKPHCDNIKSKLKKKKTVVYVQLIDEIE